VSTSPKKGRPTPKAPQSQPVHPAVRAREEADRSAASRARVAAMLTPEGIADARRREARSALRPFRRAFGGMFARAVVAGLHVPVEYERDAKRIREAVQLCPPYLRTLNVVASRVALPESRVRAILDHEGIEAVAR
jgi:hypothetical protein